MPTESVSIGYPITLTQNIVYALPPVKCNLYASAGTFEQSNTLDFTVNTPVTLIEGQFPVSGGFIRSTAGDATVILKRD
jgi:hypothetical protein